MKVYIAGKITGLENYKQVFAAKEKELQELGYTVMNPSVLPYPGFEHHEYIHICKAMIDVCDAVAFTANWEDSEGAKIEMKYAFEKGKAIWLDDRTAMMVKTILEGGSGESERFSGIFGGCNKQSR